MTFSFFKTRSGTILFWVMVALIGVFISIEALDEDDYFIYYSGAHDLIKGDNIYNNIYNSWYHYLYSVFFALIMYPLSLLPFYLSKLIWLGASVFFLYRIFVLIYSYFDLAQFEKKKKNWFFLLSVLFCLRFINDNFHCGQITIFILFLCMQGIQWIREGKFFWGALLIALGINIKIMPIVLIPYLIYRKQFLPACYITAFVVLFIFLPSVIIGHARNMDLLSTWWGIMNPTNTQHIVDVDEQSFHSFTTFFAIYLYDTNKDTYWNGMGLNIAHLTIEQLGLVINAARLIVMAGTFWFLRTLPFKKETGKLHTIWEMSYLLAVVPLIFPHQHHYAFIYFLPASVYMLFYIFSLNKNSDKGKFRFYLFSLIFVYTCFNLQLLLGEIRPFLEHFRIITFGAIYMLVILAMANPKAIVADSRISQSV
jgi:hypothetical protein